MAKSCATVARIRTKWAKTITEKWNQLVESIFETGQTLIDAKDELDHGDFGHMIEEELPFGPSTAQRLMAIAAHPILSNTAHGPHLPPSWRTLYELSKLPDETLLARLEDGSIRPDLERGTIKAWKKPAKQSDAAPERPEPEPKPEPPDPEVQSDADELEESGARLRATMAQARADRKALGARLSAALRGNGLGDEQPIVDADPEANAQRDSDSPEPSHGPTSNGLDERQRDAGDEQSVIDAAPTDPGVADSSEPAPTDDLVAEAMRLVRMMTIEQRQQFLLECWKSKLLPPELLKLLPPELLDEIPVTASAQIRKLEARVQELEEELAAAKPVTELFYGLPSDEQRTFLAGINAVILQGLEHVRGLYLMELHSSGRQKRIEEFRALLDAFQLTVHDLSAPADDDLVARAAKPPEITRDDLSTTMQQKFDAAVRAYKKRLDDEYQDRITAGVQEALNARVRPGWVERDKRLRVLENNRKGVFNQENYNKILRCLHPDFTPTVEQKNEAFRMWHDKKPLLLSSKEFPFDYPPLPDGWASTWEPPKKAGRRPG
jgi:hypothetical protein